MTSDFALDWVAHRLGDVGKGPAGLALGLAEQLAALGPLACLVQAASLLGREIDTEVLAQLLEMDATRLADPLRQLVGFGVLSSTNRSGATLRRHEHYQFKDGNMRDFAYAQLSDPVRRRMHARIGQILAQRGSSANGSPTDLLVWHFEIAGDYANAFRWRRVAAERAIAATDIHSAIDHLQRALSYHTAVGPEEQIGVLRLLGPLQGQLHGSGSPQVASTYARCIALASGLQGKRDATTFDVLWGLQAFQLVNGAICAARETGRHLVDVAQAGNQEAQLLLADRMQGLASLLAGDIPAALDCFARVAILYDRDRHAHLRFCYASDQGAVALAHQSWAEAIAGDAGRSEATSIAALDLAARLDHAHTSAHVACVLAARSQTLGDRETSAPLAIAGRTLAARHKFPYWLAWADIILGWHQGGRLPAEGAARIDRAIEAYRTTGAGQALPYAFLLRAQLALVANDQFAAIKAAQAGRKLSQSQGLNLYAAELLRIEAEARMPHTAARRLIGEAVRIARAQGAGLFERRALALQSLSQS